LPSQSSLLLPLPVLLSIPQDCHFDRSCSRTCEQRSGEIRFSTSTVPRPQLRRRFLGYRRFWDTVAFGIPSLFGIKRGVLAPRTVSHQERGFSPGPFLHTPQSNSFQLNPYPRASNTILNGVSVALRKCVNPPPRATFSSRAGPACAPNPNPTSCASEQGTQTVADAE
jgi:hypothetical protein